MKLCFPESILDQHLVTLGKTGAGKSSALRHIVEHLLDKKKRVVILDPKGDWWGLKSSADGKSAGYPVIAFGDFKNEDASDVPINAQSGKHVAELITTGNRPAIIGFRGWMTSHMVQFWIDFASGIFNANSGELYLVGDEFHNFAPKGRIMDPQAGKCLHWSNRLLSEGRGLGIVCLIASQRPQKVHNDTLTSCETLVAMRVIHAADRSAVEDWIKGCGDKDRGKEVLNSLAGMARGEAFVWSPENEFGPKRLTFPMFQTFDSFAPPQLQKKVSQRGWADVDLNEVKEKLSSVIEEAKANDPRELRKEITHLKAEIAKTAADDIAEKESYPKILFVVQDKQIERLEKMANALIAESNEVLESLRLAGPEIRIKPQLTANNSPTISKNPELIANKSPQKALWKTEGRIVRDDSETRLGQCERAIMAALAQYSQGRTHNQIAVLTGYAGTSGNFKNSLSKLRTADFITRGQPIRATQEGLAALGTWDPLPTGQALLHYWLNKLGKCERAILIALSGVYPGGMNADEIGANTNYAPTSGNFKNSLSKLRTLELVTRGQPIRISEDFYQ